MRKRRSVLLFVRFTRRPAAVCSSDFEILNAFAIQSTSVHWSASNSPRRAPDARAGSTRANVPAAGFAKAADLLRREAARVLLRSVGRADVQISIKGTIGEDYGFAP